MKKNTEYEAERVARHIISRIKLESVHLNFIDLSNYTIPEEMQDEISTIQKDLKLKKIKLFNASGKIIYSTDSDDVGKMNDKLYFQNFVAKGETFTKLVLKETLTLEDQVYEEDVVETYVPIMEKGQFFGAFELYYNVTDRRKVFSKLTMQASATLILFSASFFVIISFLLVISQKQIFRIREEERKNKSRHIFLNTLINTIPAPLFYKDSKGIYQGCNRSFSEEILGLFPEKIIGSSIYDLPKEIPKDLADVYHDQDMALIKKTGTQIYESQVKCADGNTRDFQFNQATYNDDSGDVAGIIGVMLDISELKDIELRLRESEEKYRSMMEGMQDSAYICSPDKRISYMNPAMEEWIGKDSIGKVCHEAIFGIDKVCDWCVFEKIKKGEYINKEIYRAKDDKTYHVSQSPVYHSDKTISKMTIYHDISDYKRAIEAKLESEENFLSLMVAARDAIVILDENGKILFWNNAAEKVFGYTYDEIAGRELHALVCHSKYKDAYKSRAKEFKKTGEGDAIGNILELTALNKAGEQFPIELSVSAVNKKGKWHSIGIVRDISERKKFEEDLKRAKKNAERASDAKSEFLANMSHEIRTPMNGVVGMVDLLMSSNLDERQYGYAESIEACANSLLTIINDVLDYSKIEAGKLQFETIRFNLRSTIESVGDLIVDRANKKGLEFSYHIDGNVPEQLKGDPGRLRQVLINLAGNSVKFTSKGFVKIFIKIVDETDTHAKIKFEITDSGIGIPMEKQQSLFESFVQANNSTAREFGGTGLGLSISRFLVENMEGEIGFISREGEGTTFWFTAVFFKQQNVYIASTASIPPVHGYKILLVDGDFSNDKMVFQYLTSFRCDFDIAQTEDQAMEKLGAAMEEGNLFKILIVDSSQPGVNGEKLGLRIRKVPEYRELAMVLLVPFGLRGDALRIKKSGFSAYLVKPLKKSHLYNCLNQIIYQNIKSPGGKTEGLITGHSLNEPINLYPENVNKYRILLAEDDIINQKIAFDMLQGLGHDVTIVDNGEKAVLAFKENDFDAIFMDCQMPVLDGITAAAEIRKIEALRSETIGKFNPDTLQEKRHTPIIAFTAHAIKGYREKFLSVGMDEYITKPVKKAVLINTLDAVMEGERRSIANPFNLPRESSAEKRVGNKEIQQESETPPIIIEEVKAALDCDEHMLRNLFDMFLNKYSEKFYNIENAILIKDAEGLFHSAHHIKGVLRSLYARKQSDLARELEIMGKNADFEAAEKLFPDFKYECERLKDFMKSYVGIHERE